MEAKRSAPVGARSCAVDCGEGETSLAIHADADQGGCRDPHVWNGDALLKWYAGGHLVGSEAITFGVECSALPEGDHLTDSEKRRLLTLQLVCDQARRQYGAPPGVIDIRIDEDYPIPPTGPVLERARWRLDSGGFCHGSGIMNVAAPMAGARLVDLRVGSLGNA